MEMHVIYVSIYGKFNECANGGLFTEYASKESFCCLKAHL